MKENMFNRIFHKKALEAEKRAIIEAKEKAEAERKATEKAKKLADMIYQTAIITQNVKVMKRTVKRLEKVAAQNANYIEAAQRIAKDETRRSYRKVYTPATYYASNEELEAMEKQSKRKATRDYNKYRAYYAMKKGARI